MHTSTLTRRGAILTLLLASMEFNAPAQPALGNPLSGLERLKNFETRRASSSDANWKQGNSDSRPIPPGGTLTLAELDGPGQIVHIWCTVAQNDPFYSAKLTLRMYWDDEQHPSVECPVGDFFGIGFGVDKSFTSLPVRVTADGRGRNCYWPMPFRKKARLTVTNESTARCDNFYYYLDWQKHDSLPDDVAYFHAMYRQEYPCVMGRNYLIADIEGRGHYVGTVKSVYHVSPGWYGEGDDFFFIDGEQTPSLRGTGTEDYFGDGWGFREQAGPFYGTPLWEGFNTGDRGTAYRFHVPDPVTFQKSLRVEIEHKGYQEFPDGRNDGFVERDDLFSSVAIWYQVEPHKPWPALPPGAERLPFQERLILKGHEAVPAAKHSEHPLEVQALGGVTDSKQLWFKPADDKGWVEVEFTNEKDQALGLACRMTHSWDYGIYRVRLDGREVGQFDLYSPGIAQAEHKLGTHHLAAGTHVLRFECVGRSSRSAGYFLGLDVIKARVPVYSRAPDVDVRTMKKAERPTLFNLAPGYAETVPVPDVIKPGVADKQPAQLPDTVDLDGFLGVRLDANAMNRLARIDEDRLLEGFRRRPGRQAWDGEHVGKWLHAATLAWDYTRDARLREKLDRVVVELARCQLEDGYLGTYLPAQRWTEWDVWAHKYDMIGLLTYYRFTGNKLGLEVSRRCADLLCRTFGDNPGQRDILEAGWHVGMAPTSVLEPMVLLYRLTGEAKYLDFCRYILNAWEKPKGPKIISTLLSAKRVDKVGNGKAYEMLSCLNGALELYRVTGDKPLLQAALNAWQDIVDKRLYLTGTASHHEHFHDDHDLPNGNANVGETCVTVTWLQFNAQLLRLTGEARFAEELERTVYNQLLGAQKPDGSAWGYYVQLEGRKPYSTELSGHCCLSSGPRGVALIPTFAFATDNEGPVINFLAEGSAQLNLTGGPPVELEVKSQYPADGKVQVGLRPRAPATFTVKVRIPAWSEPAGIVVNGRLQTDPFRPDDYAVVRRQWREGDVIELTIPLTARLIVGTHGNAGKVAFAHGPMILAADDALNPTARIGGFRVAATNLDPLALRTRPAPADRATWAGAQIFSVKALPIAPATHNPVGEAIDLHLVPFADAGSTLEPYQVWLP